MRGPCDFNGTGVGSSGDGIGATGGCTGNNAADAVFGFNCGFCRRFTFGWGSVQTNSLTIVRLVLTPCRVNNPAMAPHEAPLSRSSMMTSRQGWRFWKRGRRHG